MLEIKITLFIVKQVHVLLYKVLMLIWQKKKNTRKYDIIYSNMNFEGKLSIYTCKIYKVGNKLQGYD